MADGEAAADEAIAADTRADELGGRFFGLSVAIGAVLGAAIPSAPYLLAPADRGWIGWLGIFAVLGAVWGVVSAVAGAGGIYAGYVNRWPTAVAIGVSLVLATLAGSLVFAIFVGLANPYWFILPSAGLATLVTAALIGLREILRRRPHQLPD